MPENQEQSQADHATSATAQESPGPGSQLTALASKLIDLADAGVGLGINMISLINSYAQHQLKADSPEAADAPPPSQQPVPREQSAARPAGERAYCIVNRTALQPGGSVRVAFSINNERPDVSRHLHVSVLGFTGATSGASLPQDHFSIDPSERVIEPVDFDKFVLTGSVPADAPPDSYSGWVLVSGDEEMRIPVMLLVSPQE